MAEIKPTRPARSKPTPRFVQASGTMSNTAPLHMRRGVVIGVAFIAMLVAAAAVWFGLRALSSFADSVLVREVVFVSTTDAVLSEVDSDELQRIAEAMRTRRASMLQLDLAALKAEMQKIAWVRDAVVQRRFPATIVVAIEEHRPAAVWLSDDSTLQNADSDLSGLVNTFGEVFRAEISDERKHQLPVLSGPEGTSLEVLEKFAAFVEPLKPIARTPRALTLTARRAWQLTLDNGTVLALGRSDVEPRMARFIATYPQLPSLQQANATVDLRYQAGFTVKSTSAVSTASRKPA
jgi:cell division protein FtsQ